MARLVGEAGLPVDRGHRAAELREDRRLVARSRADVEDPVAGPHREQLGHPGDDVRLADRLAGADGQRAVGVGLAPGPRPGRRRRAGRPPSPRGRGGRGCRGRGAGPRPSGPGRRSRSCPGRSMRLASPQLGEGLAASDGPRSPRRRGHAAGRADGSEAPRSRTRRGLALAPADGDAAGLPDGTTDGEASGLRGRDRRRGLGRDRGREGVGDEPVVAEEHPVQQDRDEDADDRDDEDGGRPVADVDGLLGDGRRRRLGRRRRACRSGAAARRRRPRRRAPAAAAAPRRGASSAARRLVDGARVGLLVVHEVASGSSTRPRLVGAARSSAASVASAGSVSAAPSGPSASGSRCSSVIR